jgi:hypothetical protein
MCCCAREALTLQENALPPPPQFTTARVPSPTALANAAQLPQERYLHEGTCTAAFHSCRRSATCMRPTRHWTYVNTLMRCQLALCA